MNLQKITEFIDNCFLAVTFAEANCHEIIEYNTQVTEQKDTIDVFLKNIGLQNAKVSYGLVDA